MKCRCPSCRAGLTCYRANCDVALPNGRVSRHLLYGEMVLLANTLPELPIMGALRRRQTILRAGVVFEPTRPRSLH